MRIVIAVLITCTFAGTVQAGGQASAAETRAKTIAPYLDNNSFVVARFDLTRPDCDELASTLFTFADPMLGMKRTLTPSEIKTLFASLRSFGAKEVYGIYSFAGPAFSLDFVVPVGQGINSKSIIGLFGPDTTYSVGQGTNSKSMFGVAGPDTSYLEMQAVQVGSAVVFGTPEACQRYRNLKAVPRPELQKSFAAVSDMTAQLCVMLSPDARRAFEELIPTLPPEIGGGSITLWTRGFQWIAIGLDGLPKMSLHTIVQGTDEAATSKLKEWIGTALKTFAQNPNNKEVWKDFDKLAAALQPTTAGDKLVVKLNHEQMTALVQPMITRTEFAADRTRLLANLSTIGKAMHMHHDATKAFPTPANYDKQGKPLLSWRVQLLPYLKLDKLYKEFKLDEPWDSAHNKKLIAKIPAIYRHPLGLGVSEGKTPFVVPIGDSTAFPGGKGTMMPRDFSDGTSNTVLVFIANDDNMVTWTTPEDWPFDPKDPHRGLVDKNRERIPVLMADASVRLLNAKISAATLRALITRNAGDPIGSDFDK